MSCVTNLQRWLFIACYNQFPNRLGSISNFKWKQISTKHNSYQSWLLYFHGPILLYLLPLTHFKPILAQSLQPSNRPISINSVCQNTIAPIGRFPTATPISRFLVVTLQSAASANPFFPWRQFHTCQNLASTPPIAVPPLPDLLHTPNHRQSTSGELLRLPRNFLPRIGRRIVGIWSDRRRVRCQGHPCVFFPFSKALSAKIRDPCVFNL